MKQFSKKIDHRSRKEMAEYLKGHFRYDTMNGWNRMTSYANDMKIYRLGLTHEQEKKLYDIMQCEDAYDSVNALIDSFGCETDYRWQAGFNGRSGGYLVLYSGGMKQTEWKSYCIACGQRNYKTVEESGCVCGRCRAEARINYKVPPMQIYTNSKGIDDGEDFEYWSIEELRERCELVERFDELCDEIVAEAASIADTMVATEEEILIPATRKVLKEVAVC